MSGVESNLGKLRRQRGVSAIHLAAAVGVSRQTIYAMEAGTYVPNTAVALRLARALDATVEQLFTIGDRAASGLRSESALLLRGSGALETGQPVQLCRVGKRLIASASSPIPWYFPATDAVAASKPERQGRTRLQIFSAESDFSNRILVAGCDPGISVLARHAQAAGVDLVLA
ncbi:MAG: helix-turn-helix domain-containing protein, partial [Acidobacteriota bacterium]|nr:helix-turn-helix domain-containing protein [Acidobacteriota bacterium]